MKSLLNHDARFVIASDGPLMWVDTFSRLEGAITRKAPDGGEVALAPNEAIGLPAAIRAMTIDSAYLMSQEKEVGSIELGKRADFIVLDKNLTEIPPEEIDSTKVLVTVFDGKVVYDAAKGQASEESVEIKYGVDLDFSGENGYPGCEWYQETK